MRKHSKAARKAWKENKRVNREGLDYAVEKAYDKYIELSTKAIENGRDMIEEFSRTDIKNMIKSEHAAGADWTEAINTTTSQAFRDSFNTYVRDEEGQYNVQVLSEKQAENWLKHLRQQGEDVRGLTVEDLMTGKFDTRQYWKALTQNLTQSELTLMTQYFFGS